MLAGAVEAALTEKLPTADRRMSGEFLLGLEMEIDMGMPVSFLVTMNFSLSSALAVLVSMVSDG